MSCVTRPIRLLLPLLVWAAYGCGSEVVVDPGSGGSAPGTGASGTGASGTGASGTGASGTGGSSTGGSGTGATGAASVGGGGGGIDCAALEAEMVAAHDLATTCDPLINALQCTGATIAKTYCNCSVVANDANPSEAAESFALGELWYESCEYNFCESGCYPTDAPWYCDPATNRCQPAYE